MSEEVLIQVRHDIVDDLSNDKDIYVQLQGNTNPVDKILQELSSLWWVDNKSHKNTVRHLVPWMMNTHFILDNLSNIYWYRYKFLFPQLKGNFTFVTIFWVTAYTFVQEKVSISDRIFVSIKSTFESHYKMIIFL